MYHVKHDFLLINKFQNTFSEEIDYGIAWKAYDNFIGF